MGGSWVRSGDIGLGKNLAWPTQGWSKSNQISNWAREVSWNRPKQQAHEGGKSRPDHVFRRNQTDMAWVKLKTPDQVQMLHPPKLRAFIAFTFLCLSQVSCPHHHPPPPQPKEKVCWIKELNPTSRRLWWTILTSNLTYESHFII